MKKNIMMRLASFLLVAVLISTSAISGTYAKYVTSDTVSDNARVAKFGVVVAADGELFSKNYVDEASGNTPGSAALTVESSDTAKVVAPGTKNDKGMTFSVTGKPEVKVDVKFDVVDITGTNDIYLAQKNDLPDMTTGDTEDKFNNTAVYHPVKFTLVDTDDHTTLVDKGTLEEIEDTLEALSTQYDANTNLTEKLGSYCLTWEWDFDDNGAGTYDKQDTLLGDLAAGTTLTPATTLTAGTDYCLNISFGITITVTQID